MVAVRVPPIVQGQSCSSQFPYLLNVVFQGTSQLSDDMLDFGIVG